MGVTCPWKYILWKFTFVSTFKPTHTFLFTHIYDIKYFKLELAMSETILNISADK